MNKKIEFKYSFVTSFMLHILAMTLMLMDHTWATVLPNQVWLTCLGRIAFPIFAFMIVEGFFHSHDIKKYILRMFVFAIITEIPFDLMYGSSVFYPVHQNVLWTFFISLIGLYIIDKKAKNKKRWQFIAISIFVVIITAVLGFVTMVDYYGFGILTVYVFYFFRGKEWWKYLGQIVCLYIINVEMLGGLCYIINIFGRDFEIVQQGFALFALIPIFLYNGKQGYHSKWFQYFCYIFYPLHALILSLL